MACQSQSTDWSSPSIDVGRCSLNPNASTPAAPTDFGTVHCKPVPVKCGSASGIIHLDKLKVSSAGNKGGIKCILCDSAWYTPVEFENLGGGGRGVSRRGAQGAQAPPSSSRSSMLNVYCIHIIITQY